jgi:hypothetical protein
MTSPLLPPLSSQTDTVLDFVQCLERQWEGGRAMIPWLEGELVESWPELMELGEALWLRVCREAVRLMAF